MTYIALKLFDFMKTHGLARGLLLWTAIMSAGCIIPHNIAEEEPELNLPPSAVETVPSFGRLLFSASGTLGISLSALDPNEDDQLYAKLFRVDNLQGSPRYTYVGRETILQLPAIVEDERDPLARLRRTGTLQEFTACAFAPPGQSDYTLAIRVADREFSVKFDEEHLAPGGFVVEGLWVVECR